MVHHIPRGTLSFQVPRDLPDLYTKAEVLIKYRSATQSAALPPMIGGSHLCVSVFLVVNSFTISQQEVKRQRLL